MAFHNTVRNEYRRLAVVLMVAGSCWFARPAVLAGMLTAGNILVSYTRLSFPGPSRTLVEYNLTGQFVQTFAIPYPFAPLPTSETPRDIFVTPDGLAPIIAVIHADRMTLRIVRLTEPRRSFT